MEKIYNKLVRDKIPEIIERDGKRCEIEILSKKDYIEALDKKMGEELAEYLSEPRLEELADLIEVVYAATVARGFTLEELEKVRQSKTEKRGGFEKRICLKRVFEDLSPTSRLTVEECAKSAEDDVTGNVAIEMHLADEPFELIKSGEKTVEIRLYDEKRKKIKVGDTLLFFRGDGKTEFIKATVVGLYTFNSFRELFASDMFSKTGSGILTVGGATESMYRYYTQEQEKKYGVLAIELKI